MLEKKRYCQAQVQDLAQHRSQCCRPIAFQLSHSQYHLTAFQSHLHHTHACQLTKPCSNPLPPTPPLPYHRSAKPFSPPQTPPPSPPSSPHLQLACSAMHAARATFKPPKPCFACCAATIQPAQALLCLLCRGWWERGHHPLPGGKGQLQESG